jgi:(1->4)-alpha-D-glucan 1-alpha-D-glucosylmutase
LLVEKILAVGETLPPSWPVDGTTGYEHIRVTEHTMLSGGRGPLTSLWTELTGDDRSFAEFEDAGRREVLDGGLRPDLDRLVRLIAADRCRVARQRAATPAVVELTIGLHRYRTYLPDDDSVAELDAAHVGRSRRGPTSSTNSNVLVDLIAGDPERCRTLAAAHEPGDGQGGRGPSVLPVPAPRCALRGRRRSGPVETSVSEFHRPSTRVQVARAPLALLAGTTHDTKRSEGCALAALALAEIADDWAAVVRVVVGRARELLDRGGIDAAATLLALETAVTAWPIDAERLTEYLVKSAREAEEHTSWTAPDAYSLVDPDNRVEPDWDERRALVDRAAGIDISAARVDGVEQARHAVSDRASDIEAAKAVVITRTPGAAPPP